MEELHHFKLPCPNCGAEVHVVASPASHRSRWCCLHCLTVGTAPFYPPDPSTLPRPPIPAGNA